MEKACAAYGAIKDLTFYEDKSNGKFKGYVLVEYSNAEDARACKEGLHGKQFDGKPCVVTYAQADSSSVADSPRSGGAGGATRKDRVGQQRAKPYDRKKAIAVAAFGSAPYDRGNPRPPWETKTEEGEGDVRDSHRRQGDRRRRDDRRRRR